MAIRWILVPAALLAAAATAQDGSGCDDGWRGWRTGPNARFCETRELTLPAQGTLIVDAGDNGGIRVTGENRRDIRVVATVQAWGRDEAEAQRIASAVVVRSDGEIRAEGPGEYERGGWSVSYEVLAPREIDLSLTTHNGGISVADVRGDLELEAQNGGLNVDSVAGDVRGRTTNGGVEARLAGETWEGKGLDLATTNGGIRLRVPEDYSARLETRTVNGGVDIDFPVTVQGSIGRSISTTLGDGGALVRAVTTNGQVRVSRGTAGLTRVQ
jgi:DUF4097 and DUF4098 domain-containing protein YvlB